MQNAKNIFFVASSQQEKPPNRVSFLVGCGARRFESRSASKAAQNQVRIRSPICRGGSRTARFKKARTPLDGRFVNRPYKRRACEYPSARIAVALNPPSTQSIVELGSLLSVLRRYTAEWKKPQVKN